MEFLKDLFEKGALTWDEFSSAVSGKGYKIADLATGNYVSKRKYDDEIRTKDNTITDLNNQISTRDTDITNLQAQIADGSNDSDTKLNDLQSQLSKLQGDYESQKTAYEQRLASQNYEFAVRDFANSKKFSSNAAKRDFINEMIAANLTMNDKSIMGAEDFVTKYQTSNADAFIVETPPEPKPEEPKPTFVTPTTPQPNVSGSAFANAFNFVGVRPHDSK